MVSGFSPPFYVPTFRTVHYNPTSTKHFSFSVGSVPRALQPQLGILRYFASYMEQHLMKVCVGGGGGGGGGCGSHSEAPVSH